MKVTFSVIKADVGGYVGHSESHPDVLAKAGESLAKAKESGLLVDYQVTKCGDDLQFIMTHEQGENSEKIHKLAWDTFVECTEIAKQLKLHGAGQDLLTDAFSGTIKGMGPGVAEMEFEERAAETVIVFMADKTSAGAWNMPLYKMFADPFNTVGLVIAANRVVRGLEGLNPPDPSGLIKERSAEMDFSLSPQEEAFRKELSDWLDENTKELPEWWRRRYAIGPEIESEEYQQLSRWWHKKLYDAGYVGIAWPKEYGGRGATIMEQVIFNQEMAKRRTPAGVGGLGVGWAGPTIIVAGTEEQKKRFLPRILSGEDVWCQAFSEPEAGSDLANCQTRAVEDGDYYIVNGQKVWTTGGMRADWAILLAKTDFNPETPRHRTFSYFILDMHAPGVTVRPLREMTGYALFGETFLDDVRIHKSLMVGEKNRGWYISMATLEFERSNSNSAIGYLSTIANLIELAQKMECNGQTLSKDPLVRQKLAQFYIEANVGKYIGLRALTRQLRGQTPGPESSVGSLLTMELSQRIQDFAMYLQGPYSQLVRGSKYAIDQGAWQRSFLNSRGNTIMTGTSEIKRNIIAQRTLGLPRYTQ